MTKQSREARETRLRNLHLIDKLRSVQTDMRYLAKLLDQRGDSDYCSAFNGDAEAIQTIIDDVSNETQMP